MSDPRSSNKMVYLGILIQLAVTCIGLYPPPIQRVFLAGTVRADWWVASLPFALLLWGFDEGRKWLIRRYPGGFFFSFCSHPWHPCSGAHRLGGEKYVLLKCAQSAHILYCWMHRERERICSK